MSKKINNFVLTHVKYISMYKYYKNLNVVKYLILSVKIYVFLKIINNFYRCRLEEMAFTMLDTTNHTAEISSTKSNKLCLLSYMSKQLKLRWHLRHYNTKLLRTFQLRWIKWKSEPELKAIENAASGLPWSPIWKL